MTSRCCGAARRTGLSLRLRNFGEMNSQSADLAIICLSTEQYFQYRLKALPTVPVKTLLWQIKEF
jgi:hypothetical protein